MSTKTLMRAGKRRTAIATRRTAETSRFELGNRIFFRLYQSSNLMHRTGTRAVAAHGATTQQWAVMGALSRRTDEGMSVKDLMAFLAVSRQSLTIVLNRLEGLNLVERVRTKGDGRVRRIRLTGYGSHAWTRMLLDIRAYYADALDQFTDEEAETFFLLLDRLTKRLSNMQARNGAGPE